MINFVLMYYFGKYAWNNPDWGEECNKVCIVYMNTETGRAYCADKDLSESGLDSGLTGG